jgi:hypothetical protein
MFYGVSSIPYLSSAPAIASLAAHQLRQLGDVRRDPPRLVFRE